MAKAFNWETSWRVQWCGVHDQRECKDCWRMERLGPMLFSEFDRTPGDGMTECGGFCRCVLLFREILTAEPGFSESLPESYMKLKAETGNLYFEKIETAKYLKIIDLTVEYERLTSKLYGAAGNWNLPETYYTEISGADERIRFLKELIRQIKSGNISKENKAAIMARMSRHWGGVWPERVN